jgi:phage baseplate assembly protein W
MKAQGNGRPEQCAENLLKITRGEVPYDRLKGLSSTAIDKPTRMASASLKADAEWLLKTYEPRIDLNSLNVNLMRPEDSAFLLNADIKVKGEDVANG